MALERVQKILAKAGIASRRQSEEMIALGEVTVNGKIAKLGDKAEFGKDDIKVRGKLISETENFVYYLVNKPKGLLCTLGQDRAGRPTLDALMKRVKERIFPVGRLDFNSEGILLMTNDGDLAEKLQKDSHILRVYQVKIKGHPDTAMLNRLNHGVKVGDHYLKAHAHHLLEKLQSKSLLQLIIKGGSAFDVKGFLENKGFLVEKIVRTHIGHLNIRALMPGEIKKIEKSKIDALFVQPVLAEKDIEKTRVKSLKKTIKKEKKVQKQSRF